MNVETAKKHHVAYIAGWRQGADPPVTMKPTWVGESEVQADFDRGVVDGAAALKQAMMIEFERLKAIVGAS